MSFSSLEELQQRYPLIAHLLPLNNQGHKQGTVGWLLERDSMLTCSDFAAAMGEDNCKSALRLFRQKTNQETLIRNNFGSLEHFLTSEGNRQEDLVRKFYESLDPENNAPVFDRFSCVRHSETPGRPASDPKYSWLGGSPDGIVGPSGRLIEIKNAISRTMVSGGVPKKYFPQIQGLMEIFNIEECDYIEYHTARTSVEADTWQVIRSKRDREWWAQALPKLKAFWDKVLEYRAAIRELGAASWALCLRSFHDRKAKPHTFLHWSEFRRYVKAIKRLGPSYKLRKRGRVDVEGEGDENESSKRKRVYDNSHQDKCEL